MDEIHGQYIAPAPAHKHKGKGACTVSVATYGERQAAVADSNIFSVPEAQARAQAQILQFGHPVYDLKFNTLVPGCTIGQSIPINLPAFGINKSLIIKRVEAVGYAPGDDVLGIDGHLEYQIECIGSDTYILRLIGQVITVSLETQQIIGTLPSLNLDA